MDLINTVANNEIIFYLIVLLSSVLSSSLGAGSFILIPIAALRFGVKESVGILTIYFLFQNINKILFFRKHIQWNIAKKIIFWAIPGAILGAFTMVWLPEELFKKILGCVIIIFIGKDLWKHFSKNKFTGVSDKKIPFFGFFYGVLSGTFGSGNLVKGPLFLNLNLLKESYIATYAITSFFINVPKIFIYLQENVIDKNVITISLNFLLISIVGTWLGKNLIKKIHNDLFYLVVTVFFIFSALLLLIP